MKIAVILTCFNRREKTLRCLSNLFRITPGNISLKVYLTDDGCTDGTADAIRSEFMDKDICILKGTGSLYWAGGMRFAWREALKRHEEWDFYLLLNDDTFVFENLFEELLGAHEFALRTYGNGGIYSGATCASDNHELITYGGGIYLNSSRTKFRELQPNGKPQLIDKTNANILLVSKNVVDKIGIFHDGYVHSSADFDYGIMTRKSGLPALVTANACGVCDFDHISDECVCMTLANMPIRKRLEYVRNPLNREVDFLTFVRRHNPEKYPVTWMLRKLRCLCPRFYIMINRIRGRY